MRRSRTGRWWIGGIIAALSLMWIVGATAGLQAALLAAAAAFSALIGFAASMRSGRDMFELIISRPADSQPKGIERWLPLKGYWLRLFFGAPGVALAWGLLWMVMSVCVFLAFCVCATPFVWLRLIPGR